MSFKVFELYTLRSDKLAVERLILLLVHGTVDVVGISAVVARCKEHLLHVKAVISHDRSCRVVEAQSLAAELLYYLSHCARCERSCRDNGRALGELCYLSADDLDMRVGLYPCRNAVREFLAVNCKSSSRLDCVLLCAWNCQRAEHLHFRFQQSRSRFKPCRLERIRAYKLGKTAVFMRRSVLLRLHFIKLYIYAVTRERPCCLAAGKSRTYYIYGICHFFSSLSYPQPSFSHMSLPDLPPLLKRVLPQSGHFSAVGTFHVMKLQSG